MPELPEVETVRRGLADRVVGRRIDRVEVGRPRTVRRTSATEVIDGLTGATMIAADRRGKYLLCPLDTGDTVMFHLRMSGQLLLGRRWRPPTGAHPRGPVAGRAGPGAAPLRRPPHVRRGRRVRPRPRGGGAPRAGPPRRRSARGRTRRRCPGCPPRRPPHGAQAPAPRPARDRRHRQHLRRRDPPRRPPPPEPIGRVAASHRGPPPARRRAPHPRLPPSRPAGRRSATASTST